VRSQNSVAATTTKPDAAPKICQLVLGGANVKLERVVVIVTCLALVSVTPGSAAPQEIEFFCLDQLRYVPLSHPRGTGEAFMANCIANLTQTPTQQRSC